MQCIKRLAILSIALIFVMSFTGGGFAQQEIDVSTYEPASLYKLGLAWDYPPYLLVNIPATPGDAIFTQGPFPYVAPVMQKSGWITGHAGLYVGRKDNNNDGIDEFVTAESARYGVWYGYFYPMHRFEKGHGKMEDYFKKDAAGAKLLKKVFGDDVAESDAIKKYDELLDGTYMGARNVDFLTESPDEFVYRRKILEFAHNYVLKNADYNYEGFSRPLMALLFSSRNTQGTGGYGKGHSEQFTCVGLVEAAFEYAGINIVPKYIEEISIGLSPLKQFLYTKPVSKLFIKKGETVSFDVWHVIHGHRNFEHAVNCSNLIEGCSFDGKTFTADSSKMQVGTYEIEFSSVDYTDQKQKVKIIVSEANRLPNFDFKDVASDFKGIETVSQEIKDKVEAVGSSEGSKKELDQKLLQVVLTSTSVDDAVYAAKNIKNGAARDIALLYSLKLANDVNDLYKLSMFTDSPLTVNKILYSPVGFRIQGIEKAMNKIINADGFSLFYNMKCSSVLKDSLKSDHVFDHGTNMKLQISFNDVSSLDVNKIMGFINYLCQNPTELNRLENSYLIALIQKRVYFGIANKEENADLLRSKISEMHKRYEMRIDSGSVGNKSNVSDNLLAVRFLYSMTQSLDTDKKWLDDSLAAEKTFMKTATIALAGVPGAGTLLNQSCSETASGPFAKTGVIGKISSWLSSFVSKEEGVSDISSESVSASSVSTETVEAAKAEFEVAAQAGENVSSEVKQAYDNYRLSYQKYVEAINSGTAGEEELSQLVNELSANADAYKKLSVR